MKKESVSWRTSLLGEKVHTLCVFHFGFNCGYKQYKHSVNLYKYFGLDCDLEVCVEPPCHHLVASWLNIIMGWVGCSQQQLIEVKEPLTGLFSKRFEVVISVCESAC